MAKGKTLLTMEDLVLAVITHPEDFITVEELVKSLEVPKDYIWKKLGQLKVRGYLKVAGSKGRITKYRIAKRDKYVPGKSGPKGPRKPSKKTHSRVTKLQEKRSEKSSTMVDLAKVSMEDLGAMVYDHITKLERRIQDLSEAYSNMQSELKKEQESARITIKTKDKMIADLKETVELQRKTIRRSTGKTFNMSEIARFS